MDFLTMLALAVPTGKLGGEDRADGEAKLQALLGGKFGGQGLLQAVNGGWWCGYRRRSARG